MGAVFQDATTVDRRTEVIGPDTAVASQNWFKVGRDYAFILGIAVVSAGGLLADEGERGWVVVPFRPQLVDGGDAIGEEPLAGLRIDDRQVVAGVPQGAAAAEGPAAVGPQRDVVPQATDRRPVATGLRRDVLAGDLPDPERCVDRCPVEAPLSRVATEGKPVTALIRSTT